MDTESPTLPRIYLSNLPELNWLTGVEFGRVDDGQPSDCWVALTENIGVLLDEPGGRPVGFKLLAASEFDEEAEGAQEVWDGPRFHAPQVGLEDASIGEIVIAARTFFDDQESVNRSFFSLGTSSEGEKALFNWRCCLEAGDSMAHFALGYTLYELGRQGKPLRPYSSLLNRIAAARDVDVSYLRMPIRDVSVPQPWEMEATIAAIEISIAKRHPVYVHCLGGIGRTGTVLGCYGIHRGIDADSVLERLAYLRRHTKRAGIESPETAEQRTFVTRWPRSKAPGSIAGFTRREMSDEPAGYLDSAYPPYAQTPPQRRRWELCIDNALKMSRQGVVDGVIRSWADHMYWTRIDTD